MYHHHFAISAISRFLDNSSYYQPVGQGTEVVEKREMQLLPPNILSKLHRLDVLMMVLGTRGDIDVFLSIAKRLEKQRCRIRIATHTSHRDRIDAHGFDFFDAGGSPDEFTQALGEEPNLVRSIIRGDLGRLRKSICRTYARFWQAGFDNSDSSFHEKHAASRPFIANIVVSIPSTIVHVQAAETLHVPLVLISAQPTTPTSNFPHVLTITKPKLSPGHWWNLLSYFLFNLL
jgi:sterol 3beta-glucosyltransferase